MKSILFLVPHPVQSADYRYRTAQFIPALESAGYHCQIWPFSTSRLYSFLSEGGSLPAKISETLFCAARRLLQMPRVSAFDLVVINREVFPFFTPAMESLVMRYNPRVVYSFDDAVYVGHQDVSRLRHRWLYRFKYGSGINKVLRNSVHVIAGNRILADYARSFNSRVSTIPTVVDCTQYVRRANRPHDAPITVGWIGSGSTYQHLFEIEPALQALAESNPDKVRFTALGYPGLQLKLPAFRAYTYRLNCEVDYLNSIDIGLMPLPDTPWAQGKCAFKAIQYMAMGIPTVASPVGITSDLIQDSVNGLLASSTAEWFESLNRLLHDEQLRRQIGIEARRTIEREYSLQVWGPRFVSLIEQIHARVNRVKPSSVDPMCLRIPDKVHSDEIIQNDGRSRA